jgi:hypothetical protein
MRAASCLERWPPSPFETRPGLTAGVAPQDEGLELRGLVSMTSL